MRVVMRAHLGDAEVPIQIDIGFGAVLGLPAERRKLVSFLRRGSKGTPSWSWSVPRSHVARRPPTSPSSTNSAGVSWWWGRNIPRNLLSAG